MLKSSAVGSCVSLHTSTVPGPLVTHIALGADKGVVGPSAGVQADAARARIAVAAPGRSQGAQESGGLVALMCALRLGGIKAGRCCKKSASAIPPAGTQKPLAFLLR